MTRNFHFIPDIPYKTTQAGTQLCLNLFQPLGPRKATLLYAHGGGFSRGSRNDRTAERLAKKLADDGVAVASVDYRLSTELSAFPPGSARAIAAAQARTARIGMRINPDYCGARFYAALEDMSVALGFLRDPTGSLGGPSGPVLALGASSGGIAALSLAYPPRDGWEDLNRPDAAIGVCAAMVQPWRMTADGPPALLVHGYHDGVISPKNARLIADKSAKKGAPVEVAITDTRGHRQQVDLFLDGADGDGRPWLDRARTMMGLAVRPDPTGGP